jgi:hypothetical protein
MDQLDRDVHQLLVAGAAEQYLEAAPQTSPRLLLGSSVRVTHALSSRAG